MSKLDDIFDDGPPDLSGGALAPGPGKAPQDDDIPPWVKPPQGATEKPSTASSIELPDDELDAPPPLPKPAAAPSVPVGDESSRFQKVRAGVEAPAPLLVDAPGEGSSGSMVRYTLAGAVVLAAIAGGVAAWPKVKAMLDQDRANMEQAAPQAAPQAPAPAPNEPEQEEIDRIPSPPDPAQQDTPIEGAPLKQIETEPDLEPAAPPPQPQAVRPRPAPRLAPAKPAQKKDDELSDEDREYLRRLNQSL